MTDRFIYLSFLAMWHLSETWSLSIAHNFPVFMLNEGMTEIKQSQSQDQWTLMRICVYVCVKQKGFMKHK